MTEIIARRTFSTSYIVLDSLFLILFLALLLWRRKRIAAAVGIVMGFVYFFVDYGIFHLLLGTRSISGGGMLPVLLWMSMSDGFTNFVWIWLWLERDRNLFSWSLLILLWWFCCPLLSSFLPGSGITIQRTTGAYHQTMALILFIGYLLAIIWNLKEKKEYSIPIPWLLAIGILVQAGWEISLLIGGIRSAGLAFADSMRTLIINSLLETNLGLPYSYFIFIAITARFNEDMTRRVPALSFRERIKENNAEKAGLL